jgi:protein-S-isoprenylcysteine O-methyltransferase Ste14
MHENTPGIRVLPPLVYILGLILGYGLEKLWPVLDVRWQWSIEIAIGLICLSVLLVAPVLVSFRRAATPFDVRKTATSLVTDGPNRYTRNPGYLALTLLYIGIAILMWSVWVLALIVPVLIVVNYEVIRKEERHLESQFGEEYLRYKSKVRRWI